MIGAIIGDIAGSIFEFNNARTEDFELMGPGCEFTDDTVCTVAIADAILSGKTYAAALREWCRKYPHPMGGYGANFSQWINSDSKEGYGSYGNGCLMRLSPVAWLFNDEERVKEEARKSSEVSHNHILALCTAELLASAIFRLRCGAEKETSALYVEKACGWLPEYRPFSNKFEETCMNALPVAVGCFMASTSFEDAIRKAIIVGGDSDTIGAVVGSLAEAYYGVPEEMKKKAMTFLPEEISTVVEKFYSTVKTCQNGAVALQK